ncbi:MAG: TetR/AcrR family transcriptional regulator [Oscillospiraceae bacterium]|nr:TetR/AcrR family transcriptional regulator [Oscillospiraceae bacterium]
MAKAEYRSAARSRALIRDALADLLTEKPLDKITVTDVVKQAGVNRGTFYAHYTDIPDVIQHQIQDTFQSVRTVLSAQPLTLDQIPHVLLTEVQRILEEDLLYYQKILASSASLMIADLFIQATIDYLLEREKEFGIPDHAQFLLMFRFCSGGLSNLYRDWFSGAYAFPLSELTQRAEMLLLSTVTGVIRFRKNP